jgi:hypothetical protein
MEEQLRTMEDAPQPVNIVNEPADPVPTTDVKAKK